MDLIKQYINQSISTASNNLRLSTEKIEVVALLREWPGAEATYMGLFTALIVIGHDTQLEASSGCDQLKYIV